MIQVGSKWRSNDFTLFVVEKVDGEWIHYSKTDKFESPTEQKYSCLRGAFEKRFSPSVN